MKKKGHKYKLGDILKIKFFDGSIHTGEVTKLSYMGERVDMANYQLPTYTITCKNNFPNSKREYMHYPGIGDERILEANGKALEPIYKKFTTKKKKSAKKSVKVSKKSKLDQAIDKQKDFLNGKVEL